MEYKQQSDQRYPGIFNFSENDTKSQKFIKYVIRCTKKSDSEKLIFPKILMTHFKNFVNFIKYNPNSRKYKKN